MSRLTLFIALLCLTTAFTADINGRFSFGPSGHTAIDGDGSFGGRPVNLALASDGAEMVFATGLLRVRIVPIRPVWDSISPWQVSAREAPLS